MINLEAIQVLDAIDRKGSFAGASELLFKVPSAITYTVKKLEQDLGLVLFEKQGRKSVLTPAGRFLLSEGRKLLAAADLLSMQVKEVDSGWESELRIAIDTALGLERSLQSLSELYQLNPSVRVDIYEEALGGGLEMLLQNKVDIAVGIPKPKKELEQIHLTELTQQQWVFASTPNHPCFLEYIDKARPLSAIELEVYRPVVIRDSAAESKGYAFRLFSQVQALKVDSLEAKINAQLQGLGVGFLPLKPIQEYIDNGRLKVIEVEIDNPIDKQYIAVRKGKLSKGVSWLFDDLINKHQQT